MADLEFSGERAVPGKIEPQLEFEHFARYRFASQWVESKFVVDLGSGAGYGAALLRKAGAERVVGLDIALDATHFAQSIYGMPGVSFAVADCTESCLRSGFADVVTAFELVEHVEDYRGLLRFARSLLSDRGMLVISTPNKRVYNDERQAPQNPFHVKEFYCEEFRALLTEFFPKVVMMGQSTTEGMLFSPLEAAADVRASLPEEAKDEDLSETTDFFIALCGVGDEVIEAGRGAEFMASTGNELRRRSRMINALQAELEDRTRWAKSLDARVDERTGQLSALERELEARQRQAEELEEAAQRSRREVAELREALEERLRIAGKLKREAAERDRQFLERLRDMERLDARLHRIEGDRERAERLQALLADRLRTAGEQIAELEKDQDGQAAVLGWSRDSLVEQARALHDERARGDRLQQRTRGLEEASYQHQLGLDHHSHQLGEVFHQLEALRQSGEGQAHGLADAESAVAELRSRLDSRPWQGDSPWERFWDRVRGRNSRVGLALEAEVEEALRGLARSSRPRVTVVVPMQDAVSSVRDTLASVSGSRFDAGYEVLVVGAGLEPALEQALRSSPAIRYAPVRRVGDFVHTGAARARGDLVLFVSGGVFLEPEAVARLCESFTELRGVGIVAPRLMAVDNETQVAFGGGFDGSGRPLCAGQVRDWETLEYSFTRSMPWTPGVCFMARRSILRSVARRREDALGSPAAASELAKRVRAAGHEVFVQPRASARCSEHLTELLRLPEELAEADEPAVDVRSTTSRAPRLLIVDHRLPTPDQDSGSLRMTHFLEILRDLDCQLTFVPADGLPIQPYCENLQGQGIEVVSRPWVVSPLDLIAEEGDRFDGAIVCRSDVADRYMDTVCEALAGKPVIFDTVDLQYLRERRRAQVEGDAERAKLAEAVKTRELATARRADSVLVVSEYEADLMRQELPEADVRLISNIHDIPGSATGFAKRKDLFFVGGFEHQPNVDAVCWLVEEILPLVQRRLPGVVTYIIGSKPTAEVRALASETAVVKGFVPDLSPYLSGCRLSLAPLRYGAGVKGKVNQSLAHGVPCVMTSMAAEGMGLTHGIDALLADTAEEFADAVVRGYRDARLWKRLSRRGIRNTRERFSVEVARSAIESLLRDVGLIGARRASGDSVS